MDIARKNNLKRIIRCSQIMGRNETDELSAAQIFYPCMQCADIFFLKVMAAAARGMAPAGGQQGAASCLAWLGHTWRLQLGTWNLHPTDLPPPPSHAQTGRHLPARHGSAQGERAGQGVRR